MMWRLSHSLLMVLTCVMLVFAFSADSVAQQSSKPKQKEPFEKGLNIHKAGSKDSKENCAAKYEGKLLAIIVPCIRDTVAEATNTMTTQFDDHLRGATWAFATLVMTLFGVKMLMNEGDLKKEGVMLLFKIGGVALFIDNFGGFLPSMFSMVQDGAEIVTSSLAGALEKAQCEMSQYQGEKPWNYFDCILGELFGFAPGVFVGSSIFGILGAWATNTEFGTMLFSGGIMALFFILRLIIRAVYTYLMALIVMGFLIIMSPLLIPLVLLGATFQYFEHWLRALMSTMIIPLVVLAYVTLAFAMLDKVFFDDEVGVGKILPAKDISKYHTEAGRGATSKSINDPMRFTKQVNQVDPNKLAQQRYFQNTINHWASGDVNTKLFGGSMASVDFRDKNVSKSQKLFFGFVALILIAYLLDTMLETVVGTAQQMLGGGFALGTAVNNNPVEQGLEKLKGMATKNMGATIDKLQSFNPGRFLR